MDNRVVVVTKYSLLFFLISLSYLMGFYGGVGRSPSLFVASYVISFLIMLLFWKLKEFHLNFKIIFLAAIIIRVIMLAYPPGDDIHRYIWEGEIQNAGFNPFELSPESDELKHLRNDNWKRINHKDIPTIYWPSAQILFKVVSSIHTSALAFKITMMLFDLGVLLLLFLLIKALNIENQNIVLYAFNPFTWHWFSGEGHLESVMVFGMVLSIYLYNKKKWSLMFVALSMSILTKITPFFILSFIIKKENVKFFPLFFLPFLLFIPYLNGIVSPFAVPCLFTEDFTYNGFLNNILRLVFSKQLTLYISIAIAGFSYFLIYLTTSDYLRASFLSLAVFIICSPTFHPWYLLLLTPFIVFYNSPAWIALHLMVVVKSFFWIKDVENQFWHNDPILLLIEYIPFIVIGIFSITKNISVYPFRYSKVGNVSVIVPTLNEEKNIERCLESINKQDNVSQVIISDCGSSDKTIELAKKTANVNVISSNRGRGIQISEAMKYANGDIIVVVHGDSILKEHSIDKIIPILNKNRSISGGAFGAVYADHKFPLLLPRLLNTFRAQLLGISFGDQAQFFRRDAIQKFPEYMLMEDIELSMRMKENGKTVFIPNGVISSSRMWLTSGYFKNFIKVIYLSALFLIKRRLGLLSEDCSEFYKVYYG